MAKEFNKKFMHPTRRKLVDMVLTGGEYEKDTFIGFSDADSAAKKNNRKIGDKWVDADGMINEKTEFGIIKTSEATETFQDVRAYLDKLNTCKASDCERQGRQKWGPTDKRFISKTGYCTACLANREAIIKQDGMWDYYESFKVCNNAVANGKDMVAKFKQAYDEAKQEYDFVHADGRIEKWVLEKDVEEVKNEIMAEILSLENEIEVATKIRDEAWSLLKDKNYELLQDVNL